MAAGVVPQSSCSLKPPAPPSTCSHSPSCDTVLPLPSSTTLTGMVSIASCMRARFHAPGVTVVALVPSAGPVPPPMIVVMPEANGLVDDLRADQVHVAVDRAGGEDPAVAGEDLGRGADHQGGVDAGHRVGVARLADADDPAVAHADVGLDDTPVVEDQRAGDDQIGRAFGAGARRLAHRLADDLAAAEHGLVAAGAQVALDLDEEVGVGQPDAVPGGRARTGAGSARG